MDDPQWQREQVRVAGEDIAVKIVSSSSQSCPILGQLLQGLKPRSLSLAQVL